MALASDSFQIRLWYRDRSARCYLPLIICALVVQIGITGRMSAQSSRFPTIDDLVGRSRIWLYAVSPDGRNVVYLTLSGLPTENLYRTDIYLTSTLGTTEPLLLISFRVTAIDAMNR